MDYKPGICTFCGTGCGHFLKVSQSGVDGVFPSRNHPVSRGRLCVRGWNIHELLSTTDRNTTPMVKKSGTFQPVTYEEAITEAVNNLKKYAPGETAYLASPRSSNEENYLFMKMARSVFGTNNISTDTESGHRNSLDVLNEGTGFPVMTGSIEDIQKAEVLLVVTDHDDGIIKYRDRLDSVEYIVYIGAFRNDFQEYVDVVLPITSYIETDGTYTNTERRVHLSSKKMGGTLA